MPEPLPATAIAAIPAEAALRADLPSATDIARLDLGPIPASRAHRVRPHEGNLLDRLHCLYRARAFHSA